MKVSNFGSNFMPRKLAELPYNPALKERARALRKAGNLAEVVLWKHLRNRKLCGLDFDRQRIIGNYIVDFFCHKMALVIEIDGACHESRKDYDAVRDDYLNALNLQVLRFSDRQILSALQDVLAKIANMAFNRE